MNKDNSCDIVKDLLNLYYENAVREKSSIFINEHLKNCKDCKNFLEEIKMDNSIKKSININSNEDNEHKYISLAKKLKKRKLITGLIIAGSVVVLLFVLSLFISTSVITGNSMNPTFKSGNWLLINKIAYKFGNPQRGDIIVFSHDDTYYIKRVIGLPGEKIKIDNGKIYINGNELKANYLAKNIQWEYDNEELIIDNNKYFVIGDNPDKSRDSRLKDFGTIDIDAITGKAIK